MAFVDQYLALLGLTEPLPADPLARLQVLHRAHQQSVPFNNIDLLLQRQNTLDADALQKRVLDERLGGYCFELNGAFARLLAELGYEVQSHLARVLVAGGPLEEQPRTHQVLTVKLGAGETWVVDVALAPIACANRRDCKPANRFIRSTPRCNIAPMPVAGSLNTSVVATGCRCTGLISTRCCPSIAHWRITLPPRTRPRRLWAI